MAVRTRNHILEDISRNVFNEIIPEKWVVRDKSKDYGIDCEVEIFDDFGNPTGIIFYVQLKATESKVPYNIKNLSFEKSKIFQFQSYNNPVLIVRYSHLENKLYYNWANDITSQIISEKKIIVKFSDNQILLSENIEILKNYLIRYHSALQGNYRFPVNTYISIDYHNHKTPISVKQLFKTIITNNEKYFKLVRNENDSILQLKIGDTKTYLTLTDTNFSSIGYEIENLNEPSLDYFNDILLACFSIILFNSNKTEQANDIFFNNDLMKVLNLNDDFLVNFLPHLLNGEHCEKVLNEINSLFDTSKNNFIQNISLIILMISNKLSNDKQIICEKFLQKQIEYCVSRNYKQGIGISYYNLGNFHRNLGNFKESLKYYLIARKYNSEYKNKGYYYCEIAGLLFELQKYYLSSIFYKKSIELKAENEFAKALLGDALLHYGDYNSAILCFDEFLTEQKENNKIDKEEWYLKYFCINTLILNGYPTYQRRNIKEAIKCLKENDIANSIENDMLCSGAWFQNGLIANENKNNLEAFVSFSMSALFNKSEISNWILATISGFFENEDAYIHVFYIIKLAYFYHSENYIDTLYNYSYEKLNEIHEQLMKLVDMVINDINNEPLTIRLIDDDFGHEIITI